MAVTELRARKPCGAHINVAPACGTATSYALHQVSIGWRPPGWSIGMADAAANVVLQEQLLELEALGAVFGDDLHLSRIEGDNRRFAEAVVAAAGEASAAAAAADVLALSGTIRLPDCELAGAPVHLAFVLPKKGEAPGLQVQTNAPRQVRRCWLGECGGRCS